MGGTVLRCTAEQLDVTVVARRRSRQVGRCARQRYGRAGPALTWG